MRRIAFRWLLWPAAMAALLPSMLAPRRAKAQIWDSVKRQAAKAQRVKDAGKPLTVEQEQAIGREVAAKVIAFYKLYQNDALTRYVNMVGATVAAQAERQEIQYHFAVLDSGDPNAFSAPGGYVFVTRGALALCEDESELAGVLAHEVGHVSGRHVMKVIEHDKMLRQGLAEGESTWNTPGSQFLENASNNVLKKVIDQGLAPGDEYDADARGARYAYAAGYPADGLERFLNRLDQATNQGANSFWQRTHPPVKERDARLEQLVSDQQWQDAGRPRLRERFAQATAMLRSGSTGKAGK